MKNLTINTDPPKNVTHYVRDKSNIFTITEDKLRLKLDIFKKSIEHKSSLFGYFGIVITIGIALLTTNFKSEFWKAIFFVVLVLMIFLFIKDFIFFLKNKKSIDEIIEDIKEEQK